MSASTLSNIDRGYSDAAHEVICASLLGPKAENHKVLKENFSRVVQKIFDARVTYFPGDPTFIDEAIIKSEGYKSQVLKLEAYLDVLSDNLTQHSIPWFSPRYNAHMNSDTSMPATIGYLLAMLWNQNNAAPEGGPMTSLLEYEVGQQLCSMLGYNAPSIRPPLNPEDPVGWGHITCDGSVANVESVWVARNLKFYPLSFYLAVTEGELSFIAPTFEVQLCTGTSRLLKDCSPWELLNLKVDTILDLPDRASKGYGISSQFIDSAVQPHLIQQLGKDVLEARFKIKSPVYMASITKHYSWPKSCSLSGIGIDHLIEVGVDENARMDGRLLDDHLNRCLQAKEAVYCVVSIMGTTEHGAVDPLAEVIMLREKYQAKGLSFYVHVDGAWGGYFASMLPERTVYLPPPSAPGQPVLPASDIVLQQPLSFYTMVQLASIAYSDSTTIDPHKAGFVPYPAGALCYRNERARFLVTTSAPYINATTAHENMGTYGLEGSKPGAAPTAVYLSHRVIGLNRQGYGSLLGEAAFTAVRMYCNWATLSLDEPSLIVTPFVRLPSELSNSTPKAIEDERRFIQTHIVERTNSEIAADPEAMKLISKLGPDLIINVFACNFRVNVNGENKINTDISEANFLNSRLYEKLSIRKVTDKTYDKEIIIGSTVFEQEKYGAALTQYKRRLGLVGDGDLTVITSTSMSPFPTAFNFVQYLAEVFKDAALGELPECYRRIVVGPEYHGFIMQGTDTLHLAYLPMFNVGSFRQQLIITGKLPQDAMDKYVAARKADPSQLFTLHTEKALLQTILTNKKCKVSINLGLPTLVSGADHFIDDVELSEIRVIKNRSLTPGSLDKKYPRFMPFYLYGTPEQQHIDHALLSAPNAQLTASQVTLQILEVNEAKTKALDDGLESGLIAIADTTREYAMQPFSNDNPPAFFHPLKSFSISIYKDPNPATAAGPGLIDPAKLGQPIMKGAMTLGADVYRDIELINQQASATTSIIPVTSGVLDLSEIKSIADLAEKKFSHPVVFDNLDKTISDTILSSDQASKYRIVPGTGSKEDPPAAVISRYVVQEHANDYDREVAIRKGWRDELIDQLGSKGLSI